MTDLSDFKRRVHEPQIAALTARITELEQGVLYGVVSRMRPWLLRRRNATRR